MEIKKTGRYVKDDNNFLNFDELSVTIKETGEKIKVTKEVFGFLKRDIWRLDVQSSNLRKREGMSLDKEIDGTEDLALLNYLK